jgi:hypothetical protein
MFNGAKGRFYSFTNGDILNAYHTINSMENFEGEEQMSEQQRNKDYTVEGQPVEVSSGHNNNPGGKSQKIISTIGRFLNG